MVPITIVDGVYKPTNITGGPHLVFSSTVHAESGWDVLGRGVVGLCWKKNDPLGALAASGGSMAKKTRCNEYTETQTKSLDWFKGKFTGNHGFLPSNIGLSCKFSHNPILWKNIGNLSNLGWIAFLGLLVQGGWLIKILWNSQTLGMNTTIKYN